MPLITLAMVFPCLLPFLACGSPSEDIKSKAALSAVKPSEWVVPNDNREPGGRLENGTYFLALEARHALWRGEKSNLVEGVEDPTVVPVLAFAEVGKPVTIPGPLIRVPEGTQMRIRVTNSLPENLSLGIPGGASLFEEGMRSEASDVLLIRGLRAGTSKGDELRVARGMTEEIEFTADVPGTYFYWATASERSIRAWTGIDAQLAGAIVVDPVGTIPDPEERIFVITMLDQLPDPDSKLEEGDYFRRTINGLSWPETERFEYTVGDTVRWRWINASFEIHPMHLHGFHYKLLGRGDWESETIFPPDEAPMIVTEQMTPGNTFRMEWEPSRAGNWVFHCHFRDHIIPAMERSEEERAHDIHDVERHALDSMAGLVVGMTVTEPEDSEVREEPASKLRLVALEKELENGLTRRGFSLTRQDEAESRELSFPGPPLILTRDQTTEIEVVNRMSEPTSIHWHGMELESVYDGVAGWSKTGSRVAPLIHTDELFAVRMRPPRAGTFIYHTHMDEMEQLVEGMIGALLVLERGEEWDPETDRVFVIGGQEEGDQPFHPLTVNGAREAEPEQFTAGTTYRLRIVHITSGADIDLSLERDGEPVAWRALAKDGADLPDGLQRTGPAEVRLFTGETYDFEWTPREAGGLELWLRYQGFSQPEREEFSRVFRVNEP